MSGFDLENFPWSPTARRMLTYVTPHFYDKSYVGKWIYEVMGAKLDLAVDTVRQFPDQLFPATATWGLAYLEIMNGLPVRENLPYEERRRLIYEKVLTRIPVTPDMIEKYLERSMEFEVRVADIHDPGNYGFVAPHPNVFKVYFIGNTSLDSAKAHRLINRIKQSHTTYTVNQRIHEDIDQSELEAYLLHMLVLHGRVNFWDVFQYNGQLYYNGTVLYGGKRRYGLGERIDFHMRKRLSEYLAEPRATFRYAILNDLQLRAALRSAYGINFFDVWVYDGTAQYNGLISYTQKRYRMGEDVRFGPIRFLHSEGLRIPARKYAFEIINEESLKEAVRFATEVEFWKAYPYDGSLLYNGAERYSQKRHGLAEAIRFMLKGLPVDERITLLPLTFRGKVRNEETIRHKIRQQMAMDFWGAYSYSGEMLYDTGHRYDAKRAGLGESVRFGAVPVVQDESYGALTVTQKTRDYRFYNGSVSYDDIGKYNSVYKKEVEV